MLKRATNECLTFLNLEPKKCEPKLIMPIMPSQIYCKRGSLYLDLGKKILFFLFISRLNNKHVDDEGFSLGEKELKKFPFRLVASSLKIDLTIAVVLKKGKYRKDMRKNIRETCE